MDLIVTSHNTARWGDIEFTCAIGRGGFIMPEQKIEGDGATPIGRWIMREVFYRPDRLPAPLTTLKARPMSSDDGWCEVPQDVNYNKFVKHPYAVDVDKMWREDHLYDLVVPLGYNDNPVVPNKGSAIFLHLARPDLSPTAGCVALRLEDLLLILQQADTLSAVQVRPT